MSSIFSNIEINNMSLLTYGAIGLTSIVLAVVTVFDKEGGEEMASIVEPEIAPVESNELFSDNEEEAEEANIFSNTEESVEPEEEHAEEETIEEEPVEEEKQAVEPSAPVVEEENPNVVGGKKRRRTKHRRNRKQRKTRSK